MSESAHCNHDQVCWVSMGDLTLHCPKIAAADFLTSTFAFFFQLLDRKIDELKKKENVT